MSPIAKALRRQSQAERHDVSIYICAFPSVTYYYAMPMLRIGLKLGVGLPTPHIAHLKGGAE
jgi:hypothetical protein